MRLCPDLESIKDEWKLSNLKGTSDNESYYSINIIKCNSASSIECYDDGKIDELLKYIFFTLHKTDTVVDYSIAQSKHFDS